MSKVKFESLKDRNYGGEFELEVLRYALGHCDRLPQSSHFLCILFLSMQLSTEVSGKYMIWKLNQQLHIRSNRDLVKKLCHLWLSATKHEQVQKVK